MRKRRLIIWISTMAAMTAAVAPLPAHAAFPGASGKIAFMTNRDAGNYEIYSMNPDGAAQTRLTNNAALDWDPAWSADGSRIAWMSTRTTGGDIYRMNADGSGVVQLTSAAGLQGDPSWSPDGTKIAFELGSDVAVMNANGTGVTNITANPAMDVDPSWSPDGTRIAFMSDRAGGGNQEIYVMNADGTNVTRVTNSAGVDDRPNWSPDGTRIAFRSNRDTPAGNTEIYVINPDGTGEAKLTDHASSDDAPAWSPDGGQIAFNSQRDGGNAQIYTMNADGGGPARLTTNGTVSDTAPDWQPAAYDAPAASNVTSVALVPAFRQTISATQCAARGGAVSAHGAPLSFTACDPPGFLPGTVAHVGVRSSAAATYTVAPGDPGTPADEADVAIAGSITDLRAGSASGPDYAPDAAGPDLTLVTKFRITDALNGPSQTDAGTLIDFDFPVALECVASADPDIGSSCSVGTTADATTPGTIRERRRMVLQLLRVRLNDAGANGIRGDTDDRNFAQQGLFIF